MNHFVEKFQDSQWVKLKDLNFSKKVVLKMVKGKSILDIGCGDGLLLEHIKKEGVIVKGIDISAKAIKLCKDRGLDCGQVDISHPLPFKNNSYEEVLLIDVLEHLFQPIEILKETHRVCREYVYISVPNFVSLPARIQVFLGKIPENNTPHDGHVYWMTHKEISRLLKATGFIIEEVVINTFWENLFMVKYIMRVLKKINPSLFGLSFVIKARKV